MPGLHEMSVTALQEAVRSRAVRPTDVLEANLERIHAHDRSLNSFVELRPAALDEARDATGPLAGIPVAVKDVFVDRGRAPSAGSNVHGYWLRGTAGIVRRLHSAGAVVVGYTNLHEWGVGTTSTVTASGAIRNPWRIDRVAGGSSGGSAAALAAGMVPAAIGTDAGGSIRCPAACCGVVGLKPTWGAVPLDGFVNPDSPIDHAGPMARTVGDVRVLFEVLRGRGVETADTSKLTVGVARPFFFDDIDPAIEQASSDALARISGIVSDVREIDVAGVERASSAISVLYLSELASLLARDLEQRPHVFQPETLDVLRRGAAATDQKVAKASEVRRLVTRGWDEAFAEVDVVVTPTLPAPPARITDTTVRPPSGVKDADAAYLRNNTPMNLAGVPALSLPCGQSIDGETVSLTLTADRGRDGLVLSLAEDLEEALDRKYANRIASP